MKKTTKTLVIMALSIALNIVVGNVVLLLKLPIYLDTLGTMLTSLLFGPVAGMSVGLASGVITGVTADLYSLYFSPVQIAVGLMTGLLFHRQVACPFWLKVLGVALPGTLIASSITVLLFGGITSSGSSLIVQLLTGLGLNQTLSVFLIQLVTDYADRFIALSLVLATVRLLPGYRKLVTTKNK